MIRVAGLRLTSGQRPHLEGRLPDGTRIEVRRDPDDADAWIMLASWMLVPEVDGNAGNRTKLPSRKGRAVGSNAARRRKLPSAAERHWAAPDLSRARAGDASGQVQAPTRAGARGVGGITAGDRIGKPAASIDDWAESGLMALASTAKNTDAISTADPSAPVHHEGDRK